MISTYPRNVKAVSKKRKKNKPAKNTPLAIPRINPVFLSVSEAAKVSGVTGKTIRRAIQAKKLNYKIVNNRYQIDLASLIQYLFTSTKLKNKLDTYGIGQYINKWRN